MATCLLEDTLTRSERTLLAAGRRDRVLKIRGMLQETMREALTMQIEEITGRRVAVLVNGNHVDPDVTSHVFILDGGSSRNPR